MISDETSPCTPEATCSKQGAIKQISISYSKFISESDVLISYCTRFSSLPIEDHSKSLLEVKNESLHELWTRLQAAYDAISLVHLKTTYVKYESCLDLFNETKAMISDQLQLKNISAPTPQPRVELPQVQAPEASRGIHFEVPACDTEIFDGSYEQWPSFRDMFTTKYINHPKLTQAQKLYHLRYKTKGQAGIIVKSFALNDENFNFAWEALNIKCENEKFIADKQMEILNNLPQMEKEIRKIQFKEAQKSKCRNERELVEKQVKILLNLPRMRKTTSAEFNKVLSAVTNCLFILSTLNVSTHSWDPILVYVCTAALPAESILLWEQSLPSRKKCPTWQQMKDFLTAQYEIAQIVEASRNRSSLKIQSFTTERHKYTSCELCAKVHKLKFCKKLKKLNIIERNNFVRAKRLCINCLSHAHTLKDCQSKYNCVYCRKRHHSMLHYCTFSSSH
ncbi:uncharacterized protein LOC114804559 [Zeugodacus cucurbitae]|uniref:uncharacterized protein LOC114804559 n=1 Tax=Zeugodacus cucurbitae TaxID=28588 RepID=UPI0023D95D05|nr:uncharacterized protein LOC114804559 [Zeugodacus cucurbitae]